LADDPGLGKTATALTAAQWVGSATVANPLLVLAPAVALGNWASEVAMVLGSGVSVSIVQNSKAALAPAAVTICSHSRAARPEVLAKLRQRGFACMVFDEAHAAKNPSTLRSKAFIGPGGLGQSVPYVWLLTGTPAPNHPGELWNYARFLCPEQLDNSCRREAAWIRKYCVTRASSAPPYFKIVGGKNLDDLRARMAGVLLRRRKSDHLDLPPVRWTRVTVDDAKARAELDKVLDHNVAEQVRKAFDSGAPLADVLKAMGGHTHLATWRRQCGLLKVPAAADLLLSECEDAERSQVVFAHHLDVLEGLRARLAAGGVQCVVLTGEVPPSERTKRVAEFQAGRAQIALCQIDAAGVAITLHRASDVVMVEASWVPGSNRQAVDRCHRIGQSRSVLVRFLSLKGSLDEAMLEALRRKTATLAQLY
jgi:SNF2 family DNA or RNA helicase